MKKPLVEGLFFDHSEAMTMFHLDGTLIGKRSFQKPERDA